MAALVLVKMNSVVTVDGERSSSFSTFPDAPPSLANVAPGCRAKQAI